MKMGAGNMGVGGGVHAVSESVAAEAFVKVPGIRNWCAGGQFTDLLDDTQDT